MNVLIVGLGDIAQKAYLPLITQHPDINPIFCTRHGKTLDSLMQKYRVSAGFTDFSEGLNANIDAVMIHSATSSHFQLVKQCIEQGVPVFVDKPLSDQFNECDVLLELAQQRQTPLFVGFNRRYAPLYQTPLMHKATQVSYQKNRFNLPDFARRFIYDDFIHVLDFAAFASLTKIEDFDVFHHNKEGQLASVQVHWQQNQSVFSAKMNRLAGANFERLEYFSDNQNWQIDNLSQGQFFKDNQPQTLGFNDWQTTLYKRGFVDMLEDFLSVVRTGQNSVGYLDSVWQSHWLCEQIVTEIE